MEIKRMKVDKNSVLVGSEPNGKWITADQSHIPSLESLLRRIENHQFAKKNKKESIVFENELNVGIGSVKSYKDQDGDFVCTYQRKTKPVHVEINEDYDFELNNKKEDNEQLNLWGSDKDELAFPFIQKGKEDKKEAEEDFVVSNIRNLKFIHRSPSKDDKERKPREVYDISFHKPESSETQVQAKNRFAIPKIAVTKHASPDYKFQKRLNRGGTSSKMKVFSTMLKELKTHKRTGTRNASRYSQISFARNGKWNPLDRMDGELFKATLRYNRLYDVEGTTERNFYLNLEKAPKISDEEFEKLLKTVVGSK